MSEERWGGKEGRSVALSFTNKMSHSGTQMGGGLCQGSGRTYLLLALRRPWVGGRAVRGGRVHLHRLLLLYFDVWGGGQRHVQGCVALRKNQRRIERTMSSHRLPNGRSFSQRKSCSSELPNYYYLLVLKQQLGARGGERSRAGPVSTQPQWHLVLRRQT